jgi:site-specific recombinase XerD
MNKARAITKDQFDYILSEYMRQNDLRMASLVYLLAKPMRIHDVLDMRVEDLYDSTGAVRQEVFIKEQKTGTKRTLLMWTSKDAPGIQMLSRYFQEVLVGRERSGYLFVNRKQGKKLTQAGVFWLLKQFIGEHGIEQLSSHGVRKLPGKLAHAQGFDIETIGFGIYNHKDIRNTRTYLDIVEKEVRRAQETLCW